MVCKYLEQKSEQKEEDLDIKFFSQCYSQLINDKSEAVREIGSQLESMILIMSMTDEKFDQMEDNTKDSVSN